MKHENYGIKTLQHQNRYEHNFPKKNIKKSLSKDLYLLIFVAMWLFGLEIVVPSQFATRFVTFYPSE